LDFPQQSGLVEVIDERAGSVDLDHGKPFSVPRLEVGDARDVHHVVLDAEPA
jgi:hypothetical protein